VIGQVGPRGAELLGHLGRVPGLVDQVHQHATAGRIGQGEPDARKRTQVQII
jgi:hypothetical protein